jgi:hypothetical protein
MPWGSSLRKVWPAISSSSTGDTADVAEEATSQLTGGLLAKNFRALPQGSFDVACSVIGRRDGSEPAPEGSVGVCLLSID